MTDITLEQRAQLAYETWRDTPADGDSAWPKWLAVAEALRLPAGADWVLVPREPTLEMFLAGAAVEDDTCETYRAMIAVAPRHETGEVDRG